MKFLIDTQAEKVKRYITEYPDLFQGQLITPLTGYKNYGGNFAIDNGAFSSFDGVKFKAILEREKENKTNCLFVTCPDIVGNHRRTIEIFKRRRDFIPHGWNVALVAQNGIEDSDIQWELFDCIFIGGGDPWKDSQAVIDIIKTAKIFKKWVHIGRVNTAKRFFHFEKIGADTCDGSGIARFFDDKIDRFISELNALRKNEKIQMELEI